MRRIPVWIVEGVIVGCLWWVVWISLPFNDGIIDGAIAAGAAVGFVIAAHFIPGIPMFKGAQWKVNAFFAVIFFPPIFPLVGSFVGAYFALPVMILLFLVFRAVLQTVLGDMAQNRRI